MTESSLTTGSPGSCTDLLGPLVVWVLAEMFIWIWASLISLRLFRVSLMLQEWARTTQEKMRTSFSACHNTTEVSKEWSRSLICWWKSLRVANYPKFLLSRHLLKVFLLMSLCMRSVLFLFQLLWLSTCGIFTFNPVMAVIQWTADVQKLIELSSFFTLSRWKSSGGVLQDGRSLRWSGAYWHFGRRESFWRGSRIGC